MSYESLKSAVSAVITDNGNNDITGAILRILLNNNIIPQLGAEKYKGFATPTTNPGTPESEVYYLATEVGTYANFSGLLIDGGVNLIIYKSNVWEKIQLSKPLGAINETNTDKAVSGSDINAQLVAINNKIQSTGESKINARRLKMSGLVGDMPVGLIDLVDIGVTYSNPYDLKFYSDGTLVYPMKKVDANFKQGWQEGGIVYLDPTNGDKYKSVSVAKMHDPTIFGDDQSDLLDVENDNVNVYYCQYEIGINSTSGAQGETALLPFKTLKYAVLTAIAQAQVDNKPFKVICLDEWIGSNGSFGSDWKTIPDNVKGKIVGRPPSGGKTRIVGQRENYTDTLFDWQDAGGGVWKCVTTSINEGSKNSPLHFDLKNRDSDGAPTPLKYIAEQANEALTLIEVQENPDSFATHLNGGVTTLFIHFSDKRKPSTETWCYSESGQQLNFSIGEGAVLFLENIERIYSPKVVSQAAVRARPIVVPSAYSAHTGQFWMYDCGVYGGSGEAVQIYDIQYGGVDWLVAKYNRKDGENYHSFNSAAYTPNNQGDFMKMWSNHSVIEHIGENFFAGQATLTESNQISSAHDKIEVTRLNMIGGFTYGSILADVSGAKTLNINCHPYFPTLGQGLGSPKTCYWVLGGGASYHAVMDLLFCSGVNYPGANVFAAHSLGTINHYKQKGELTSEIIGGGIINNLN